LPKFRASGAGFAAAVRQDLHVEPRRTEEASRPASRMMRNQGAPKTSCLAGSEFGPADAFPEGGVFLRLMDAVSALTIMMYVCCMVLCRALCMLLTAAM
jgi:hypothetical protein